jgi:hypothetical protein
MQEKNAQHMRNGHTTGSVHERLTDFYGPQRPPQQLPLDSWLTVRYRLDKQDACIPFLFWQPSLRPAPSSIQVAFRQIVREVYGAATTNRGVPMLYARFKMHLRQPGVYVPLLRNNLLLILPSAPNITEDRAALDVLLTVGLARYLLTREWRYRWIYLLMLFLLLADGTTLVLTNFYQQWIILLITFIATVSLVPMLYWHQRRRALQADMLAVRWLGRSRMCRGLHKLADYSHVPCRRRWSEPSLAERIERVCGPRVETCDERVTMAR